jgi:hypothetical protein
VLEDNITDEIREKISQFLNVSPEEAACKGCRPERGRCKFAQNCATWNCAEEKGVSFCFECDEFPCGFLAPSAQGAEYPHNMKVYNLCRMKLVGVDAWIEEVSTIRKRYYDGKLVLGRGPVLE